MNILDGFTPRACSEGAPQTTTQLRKWMKAEHANFQSYGIETDVYEGHVLFAAPEGGFDFCYTERGHRKLLRHFAS